MNVESKPSNRQFVTFVMLQQYCWAVVSRVVGYDRWLSLPTESPLALRAIRGYWWSFNGYLLFNVYCKCTRIRNIKNNSSYIISVSLKIALKLTAAEILLSAGRYWNVSETNRNICMSINLVVVTFVEKVHQF